MDNMKIVCMLISVATLAVAIAVLYQVNKKCKGTKASMMGSKMRVGVTQICEDLPDVTSENCNQWLSQTGVTCVDDGGNGPVDCATDALPCCQTACTCNGGQPCYGANNPATNPNVKYDTDSCNSDNYYGP